MKNNKSNESRRKLLRSFAAGSGAIVAGKSLPESWSRPIVDSVMLPAHALTSGEGGGTAPPAPTTAAPPAVTNAFFLNPLIRVGNSPEHQYRLCVHVVNDIATFYLSRGGGTNTGSGAMDVSSPIPLTGNLADITAVRIISFYDSSSDTISGTLFFDGHPDSFVTDNFPIAYGSGASTQISCIS